MTKDWRELLTLLGEDNVKRIKNEVTDALIENLKDSIDAYYLCSPELFNELMCELIEEVFSKERSKFKKALKAHMEKIIKEMNEVEE